MMAAWFFVVAQALAGETPNIDVTVKGMVCSFCVQGIEKTFKKESAVETVKVDLKKSMVSLWIKEKNSLSDDRIVSLVKDSGYNVAQIKRHTKELPEEK